MMDRSILHTGAWRSCTVDDVTVEMVTPNTTAANSSHDNRTILRSRTHDCMFSPAIAYACSRIPYLPAAVAGALVCRPPSILKIYSAFCRYGSAANSKSRRLRRRFLRVIEVASREIPFRCGFVNPDLLPSRYLHTSIFAYNRLRESC